MEHDKWHNRGLNVEQLSNSSGGEKEFEKELLEAFLESCGPHMDSLPTLLKTNKKKEAHFHAHTVKGSALQIGGYRVGAVAAKFETELEKCAATSLANVMPAAEELRAAYDEFVETLKAYVAQ